MPVGGTSSGGSSGAVRAGRAFVELYADDSRLQRTLKVARDRVLNFAKSLKTAGVVAGGVAGGIFGALGLGGRAAAESLGETAGIGAVGKALGLTAEQASRLFGVLKAGGSDLRDATEGVITFNQRVADALEGKGEEAQELFRKLGVGAEEFAKLGSDQRIFRFLDALKQLNDPEFSSQLLLKGVGEDTGKNLLKVLDLTADEIRAVADASQLSARDVEAARRSTLAFTVASASLGRVLQAVAVAVEPALTATARAAAAVAQPLGAIIAANPGLVTGFVAVAAGVGAAAAAFAGLVGAVGLVGFGLTGLTAVIAAAPLIGKIALVTAAVVALAAAFGGLMYLIATKTELGRQGIKGLTDWFGVMKDTFTTAWKGITDALSSGDLKLAFQIAFAGADVVFAKFVYRITQRLNDLQSLFRQYRWLAMLIPGTGAAAELLLPGANGLKGARQLVKEAEAELARLNRQAAGQAEQARKLNPNEASSSLLNKQLGLADSVRGTFSAFGMGAQIFGGSAGIGQKLLDQGKRANRNLEDIKRALGGAGGGLVFS